MIIIYRGDILYGYTDDNVILDKFKKQRILFSNSYKIIEGELDDKANDPRYELFIFDRIVLTEVEVQYLHDIVKIISLTFKRIMNLTQYSSVHIEDDLLHNYEFIDSMDDCFMESITDHLYISSLITQLERRLTNEI